MKHVISVLVENRFGVLSHVSGLFSARGFNIDSLTVGETEDATISRMTIIVNADDKTLEQVIKQLNKLIDVIRVIDLTKNKFADRELMFVKIDSKTQDQKEQIVKLAATFGAKVVDVEKKFVTLELSADQQTIKSFFELLRPFGIKEIVRSGRIAIGLE